MRTLRYLSLLGLFASMGAALAIGLAVSTSPPPVSVATLGKGTPSRVTAQPPGTRQDLTLPPSARPAPPTVATATVAPKPAVAPKPDVAPSPAAAESTAPLRPVPETVAAEPTPVERRFPGAIRPEPTPVRLPDVATAPQGIAVPIVPVPPPSAPPATEDQPTPAKPTVTTPDRATAIDAQAARKPTIMQPPVAKPLVEKSRTMTAVATNSAVASKAKKSTSAPRANKSPDPPQLAFKEAPQKTTDKLPAAPAAPAAQTVTPLPPVAQQVAAPRNKDVAESLEKIQQALMPPLMNAPGAAAPERVPAPAGRPLTSVVAIPTPSQPRQPPKSVASSRVESAEGDGRLRIEFAETDLRDVLDSLAEYGGLNILAGRSVQGKTTVRLRNVSLDEALGGVIRQAGYVSRREGNFVFVGTPEEVDTMQQTYGQIKTRVYRPNYVSSAELEKLIKPLISEKVGKITKFEAAANQGTASGGGSGSSSAAGIGSSASAFEGADGYAGSEVVVVRDYEAVLAQVDELVAEVDVRPMQVAIEAMILSVKLNDSDKLGVNFELLKKNNPNLTIDIGQAAEFQGTGALSIAFTDSNLHAFLDALEETNDTNVIATPRLMVLNKQRAEIHIGREQGYMATTTQTETANTATMEMLQTGTLLRLRPFLSRDGLIRLDVHPELSTGEVVEKADTLVPDKQITQVTTNVMIRDGCTVIIGGLMREALSSTVNKIPLLGGLPLVGPLFRNTEETSEREEILVLLTPHIVYEPETCREGERGACEFHRRQALVAEKMSALGTRHLGRRYFRLAQNAWAAGDRDTALHYVELAVHFDPQNRAALDLRADIWQERPNGKYSLQSTATTGDNPLDGPQIAGWLLDDLEREPRVQSAPQHPLDPGRPGTHRDIERAKVPQ